MGSRVADRTRGGGMTPLFRKTGLALAALAVLLAGCVDGDDYSDVQSDTDDSTTTPQVTPPSSSTVETFKDGDLTLCVPPDSKWPISPIVPGDPIEPIDLTGQLLRGVDLGSVIAEEASGVVYKDETGKHVDIFKLLRDNGVNCVRLRIWNDPYDEEGNTYGGGVCDVNVALQQARRAAAVGLPLLVDFHYSDFWADPGKQTVPKAWANLDVTHRAWKIKDFTKRTLIKIQETGARVHMVQIGNETPNGICGVNDITSTDAAKLLNAGAEGVRQATPDALVVLHFANVQRGGYPNIAKKLAANKVDYDVFGTSWYPVWHGTLDGLTEKMTAVFNICHKPVMICEYAHPYTFDDADGANTISKQSQMGSDTWDLSAEGQTQMITDTLNWCSKFDADGDQKSDCLGAFYWEPAWIAIPVSENAVTDKQKRAEREPRWAKYGSGWATMAGAGYDKGVADENGMYDGGSAEDNKTVFDEDGKAMSSIAAFGCEVSSPPPPPPPRPTNKKTVVNAKSVKFQDGYNKSKPGGVLMPIATAAELTDATNWATADRVKSIIITVGDPTGGASKATWLTACADTKWGTQHAFDTEVHGGPVTDSAFIAAVLKGGLWLASSTKDNTLEETRAVTVEVEYYTD